MAIAETAKLMSSLDLDTRKFDQGIGKATKGLGQLQTRTIAAGTAIGVGLERLAEKGLSALGGAIGEGIQGALTLEKAQAQTAAVIASTGGAAKVSAVQVRDLANALEDVTTVDDKTIQQGENLLLTFTAIGKDIFPQVTKAAVDMAVALNKGDAATADIDASSIRLGKALQDPLKGLTALQRVGVNTSLLKPQIEALFSLTKEEVKHWQALKKSGKAAQDKYLADLKVVKTQKAQKLILAELEKEFGKAGAAAGTGFAADINRANDAIEDAKISIAQGLMPALGEVARELAKTFRDPKVIQGLKDFGTGIGQGIKTGLAFLKTVPWDKIASSLQTAAGFARNLVDAFLGLPTWVQTAVITGWGLNKLSGGLLTDIFSSLASGLIKGVLGINAGVVNVNAATVVGGGVPTGGIPGFSPTAGGSGGLSGLVKGIPIIGAALAGAEFANIAAPILAEKIKGVTPEVSGGIAAGATQAIVGALTGPLGFPNLIGGIQSIAGNIADLIPLIDAKNNKPPDIGGQITSLFDRFPGELGAVILDAGAQRDAETSSSIQALIAQGATIAQSADVENLQAKATAAIASLDQTTYTGTSATTQAARTAGMAAASAAYGAGAGVEQAIRANRPIINVDVQISATDITQVNVVEDRGGSRSGSRDGDGGGGPGQ